MQATNWYAWLPAAHLLVDVHPNSRYNHGNCRFILLDGSKEAVSCPKLQMKLNETNALPLWLRGFLRQLSTILLVCLWQFGDMRYANNDDGCILRPFMGFATSTLPTFHLYLKCAVRIPIALAGHGLPRGCLV